MMLQLASWNRLESSQSRSRSLAADRRREITCFRKMSRKWPRAGDFLEDGFRSSIFDIAVRIMTTESTDRRSFVARSQGVRQIFARMSKLELPAYRAVPVDQVNFESPVMLYRHHWTVRLVAVSFEKPRCRPASRNPCFSENVSKMTEGRRIFEDGSVVQSRWCCVRILHINGRPPHEVSMLKGQGVRQIFTETSKSELVRNRAVTDTKRSISGCWMMLPTALTNRLNHRRTRSRSFAADRRRKIHIFGKRLENDRGLAHFPKTVPSFILLMLRTHSYINCDRHTKFRCSNCKAFARYSPKRENRSWWKTERLPDRPGRFRMLNDASNSFDESSESSQTRSRSFVADRRREIHIFEQNVSKTTEGRREDGSSDDGFRNRSNIAFASIKIGHCTEGDRQTKFRGSNWRRSPDIRRNVKNRDLNLW